jgi:hypothetical protein
MPRLLWGGLWLNLPDVFIFENKETFGTYLKLQWQRRKKALAGTQLWSAYVHAFELIMESQNQHLRARRSLSIPLFQLLLLNNGETETQRRDINYQHHSVR